MSKKLAIILCAIVFFAVVGSVHATPFIYTDTEFGNSIVYRLDIAPATGLTYNATFTITATGTGSPVEHADAFDFAFNTGSSAPTSLTGLPAGWTAWNPGTSIWNGNGSHYTNSMPTGRGGFYLGVLDASTPNDEYTGYTNGVLVTSPGTSVFTFQVTLPAALRTDDIIPFQVVYYDGITGINQQHPLGHVVTGQLSAELTDTPPSVPEPSTVLLLGAGLAGMQVFRLRSRKA